jgi:hypothetical protein
MKSEITFPERKIKVIRADVEIDVRLSQIEYEQFVRIFNEEEMNPLIRVTIHSSSEGSIEFMNLTRVKI